MRVVIVKKIIKCWKVFNGQNKHWQYESPWTEDVTKHATWTKCWENSNDSNDSNNSNNSNKSNDSNDSNNSNNSDNSQHSKDTNNLNQDKKDMWDD